MHFALAEPKQDPRNLHLNQVQGSMKIEIIQ
jgi:hypothetical protein